MSMTSPKTSSDYSMLTLLCRKYFAIYVGWIFFEFLFQFAFYPETQGRTLEELSFLFEDKDLADQAVQAVEKQLHFPEKGTVETVEDVNAGALKA